MYHYGVCLKHFYPFLIPLLRSLQERSDYKNKADKNQRGEAMSRYYSIGVYQLLKKSVNRHKIKENLSRIKNQERMEKKKDQKSWRRNIKNTESKLSRHFLCGLLTKKQYKLLRILRLNNKKIFFKRGMRDIFCKSLYHKI